MKETAVAALDPGLQKQVESARAAFERGEFDRVAALCAALLAASPGCLPVRKLQRAARIKQMSAGPVGRWVGALSGAPFRLYGRVALGQDPLRALAGAQRALDADPMDVAALRLLGAAATALGWCETAVFAYETARELEPDNLANLVDLGRACLAAGRADGAMESAGVVLQRDPAHGEALALLKEASVAQTLRQGRWESDGDFRSKLRQPS